LSWHLVFFFLWIGACFPQVKKNGSKIQVEVDVNYKTNYESNYWRGILDAQGKTDGGYY